MRKLFIRSTLIVLLIFPLVLALLYITDYGYRIDQQFVCKSCLMQVKEIKWAFPPIIFPSFTMPIDSSIIKGQNSYVLHEVFSEFSNASCSHEFVPGGSMVTYGIRCSRHGHRYPVTPPLWQLEQQAQSNLFLAYKELGDAKTARELNLKIRRSNFRDLAFRNFKDPDFFTPRTEEEKLGILAGKQLLKSFTVGRYEIVKLIILTALSNRLYMAKTKEDFKMILSDFE